MKTTKTHYVYKITNNKPIDSRKYYIGVRSSQNPDRDNYWGSSEALEKSISEIGLENFTKEILSTWETRELANAEEIRLHWEIDIAADPAYYNLVNATDCGFTTFGLVPVIDTRDNSTKSVTKEDFYKFDHYVTNSKGWTSVIDTRTNTTTRVSVDDYKKFDFYKCINTGMVSVIDTRDGLSKKVSSNDYKKYNYYVNHTSGHIAVIDIRDNLTKRVTIEEYTKYDYYKSTNFGRVTVIDTRDGNTKNVSREDFNKFDYYVSISKNKATVLDTRDGKTKRVSTDDFHNNDYYISPCKNQVTVRDMRDGSTKNVTKSDYHTYDHYIAVGAKIIGIYNSDGVLCHKIYGNFRKKCTELKIPARLFEDSYKNNSKRIKNHKYYSDWYAREEKN